MDIRAIFELSRRLELVLTPAELAEKMADRLIKCGSDCLMEKEVFPEFDKTMLFGLTPEVFYASGTPPLALWQQ